MAPGLEPITVHDWPQTPRAYVQILAPAHDGSEPAIIAIGSVNTIASRELRVTLDQPVKTGSIHELGIELPGEAAPIILSCEVTSRHREANGDWQVRLMVLNASDTDLAIWDRFIALHAAAQNE
ncbi:hypothetical protein NOR51B_1418 [Luminiphilus syltensis NOR5-1B]|uniref:PilZ domain-containing protein n=1 Tax=Luminiphilus syltensis NOR5-1B TaxID=565045 RepID=B8KST5_9GAMM|nr:PilZ domain-containing protein [Luminiphilus syltensis]EED35472.1 hypothetical protein NOR51B_1418 [Luminiphilus syltensis NOR5-1B]